MGKRSRNQGNTNPVYSYLAKGRFEANITIDSPKPFEIVTREYTFRITEDEKSHSTHYFELDFDAPNIKSSKQIAHNYLQQTSSSLSLAFDTPIYDAEISKVKSSKDSTALAVADVVSSSHLEGVTLIKKVSEEEIKLLRVILVKNNDWMAEQLDLVTLYRQALACHNAYEAFSLYYQILVKAVMGQNSDRKNVDDYIKKIDDNVEMLYNNHPKDRHKGKFTIITAIRDTMNHNAYYPEFDMDIKIRVSLSTLKAAARAALMKELGVNSD